MGRSVIAGRLSVCPPLSASTVTSSATGKRAASATCCGVTCPAASSSLTIRSGGGLRNFVATSVRDTFAMTRLSGTTSPPTPPLNPAIRYRTTAGVRSRYALASTSETPFLRRSSAVAISCPGSPGL